MRFFSEHDVSSLARFLGTVYEAAPKTAHEMRAWEESEKVRKRGKGEKEWTEERRALARKLLCERGMPVALTGVMGQAASAEALGRVFDAARGAGALRRSI